MREARLIACEMLRDELELAMARTGIAMPVVWLEKSLHDWPQKLREALQVEIDRAASDCDLILLAMAYCGGALDGVGSAAATVAVPRFDDCIRMLLSLECGARDCADCHCLYFTGQWLTSERYMLRDFEAYCRRYGEKKARRIMKTMLAHYEGYRMIDTGAYDLPALAPQACQDAAQLGLTYGEQPGSVRVLEKLLRQEFDEEFCLAAPGQTLSQRQFLRI